MTVDPGSDHPDRPDHPDHPDRAPADSDHGRAVSTAELDGAFDGSGGARIDRRGRLMLLWAAAASLGLLFLQATGVQGAGMMSGTRVSGIELDIQYGRLAGYLPLLAPLLALLAWQLNPRRAPGWLLLVGAVAAAPYAVIVAAPGVYQPWMDEPLLVLTRSAPAFTVVGVLAVATMVWQAGLRAAAASLIGTAMVIQLVGPVVIAAFSQYPALALSGYRAAAGGVTTTLTVIFGVLAIAGAIAAVAASTAVPPGAVRTPTWRVTAAGCLAVLVQLVPVVWRPDAFVREPREIGEYLLQLGLVYLVIAVVIAAFGGVRVLMAAAAVGLLTGLLGMLLTPAVEVLQEMPVLAVIAGIGAVVLSAAAALSPYRAQIAAVGLALVAIGLLVLFLLSNSDRPYSSYRGLANTLTGVLLVVGIVAAVCAVAAVGQDLAGRSDLPAVLAGLGTVFSLGAVAVVASFAIDHPQDKAPIVGLLPPVIGGLVVVVALVAGIAGVGGYRRWAGARG